MNQFETLVQECESKIRTGRLVDVARRLGALNTHSVPREWKLPLARICRRTGLYSIGLRLLSRLVLGNSAKLRPAEEAEYAVLLLRSGGVAEGLSRLERIDSDQVNESLLFRAYAHFARWEYALAIPLLQRYAGLPLAAYPRLVAKTNLALAHLECLEHQAAGALLQENLKETREHGHHHLQNTCQALLGQLYLQEGDFKQARKEIEKASQLVSASKVHDEFMAHKLMLILDGLEFQDMRAFEKLRQASLQRNDWFALREADYFSLKCRFEPSLFQRLLFGTPYPAFRERISREFRFSSLASHYVLGEKTAPIFDISTGLVDGKRSLATGGKCHQLVDVLSRDFYQPLQIAGIFCLLFPNEYFDIATSPTRVRQVIRRTRQWLRQSRIPVKLSEKDGFYSLHIEGSFALRVPLEHATIDVAHLHLARLMREFDSTDAFSNQTVCQRLRLSKASAQRLLNRAIREGSIERLGDSKRAARYRVRSKTVRSAG